MKKILLIEDDPNIQQLYQEVLQREGFEVVLAKDGSNGLAQVRQSLFDLVILDIMLPGSMNGFDVLEEMRANQVTKNVPVMVLTNLDSERQTALSIGAQEYFVKADLPMEELIGHVRKLVG